MNKTYEFAECHTTREHAPLLYVQRYEANGVDQMLLAQKEYHSAKESDKPVLKQKVDAIVYELYRLTEEEIRIVEGQG